jgi:hypothetical protein
MIENGTYVDLMADPESEIYRLISGHGGASTPGRASGSATPKTNPASTAVSRSTPEVEEKQDFTEKDIGEAFQEKINRRRSFGKAMLAPEQVIPTKGEITATVRKEHSEQGRVKKDVYLSYMKAASVWGFSLNIVCVVLQQGASVLANLCLRAWGDANQDLSGTNGAIRYLWLYGILCLSSVLLSAAGSLFIFVLCTLRSAKVLHDQVRFTL